MRSISTHLMNPGVGRDWRIFGLRSHHEKQTKPLHRFSLRQKRQANQITKPM